MVVEALTDPEQSFLNVQVAVRHGKSELLTKWTTLWFLGIFSGKRILIVCATSDLAEKFSRDVRDLMKEWGPVLFGKNVRGDLASVEEWGTTDGGYVRAVGVGGLITGMGFDLIVVDDPIKDQREARSQTSKANLVEWYSGTLRTRLEPGGTLLFTMARWAEDDLSGTLVERHDEVGGDPWKVIKMPALAECPAGEDPKSWRDELGRADGEALWPERWPADVLMRIRDSLPDPSYWRALYQQEPRARSGNMFDRDKWVIIDSEPDDIVERVRAWDLAGSPGRGDWTVGVLIGRRANRRAVILDVVRGRWSAAEVEVTVLQTADLDGPGVKVRLELPKGDAHVTDLHYGKLLPHRDYRGVAVMGNKQARAELMSSAQKRGLIDVLNRHWTEGLLSEMEAFPRGRHDDQVDAAAHGFTEIWGVGETTIAMPEVFVTRQDAPVVGLDVLPAPSLWGPRAQVG